MLVHGFILVECIGFEFKFWFEFKLVWVEFEKEKRKENQKNRTPSPAARAPAQTQKPAHPAFPLSLPRRPDLTLPVRPK